MGREITKVKIVDLKNSDVDWKKSDPEKGEYKFSGRPVYLDYKTDGVPLPDHKVQWVNKDPFNIDKWKYEYYAEVVKASDRDYWPEGIPPNAEGWYQYMDAILMKVPAHEYVARKKRSLERSRLAAQNAQKDFRRKAAQDGVEAWDIDTSKLFK